MRAVVVAYLVVLGLLVTASIGVRERRVEKAFAAASNVERVDMGVTLVVVRKEPLTGEELIPGLPRMVQVGAPIELGGMVAIDRDGARLDGPSEDPVIWHASEQQAAIILHENRPIWTLIEGSEGSNKTTTLVRWVCLRVLEHIGENVEIGITGPTAKRMTAVKEEIEKWWPPTWTTFFAREDVYQFHAGPRVRLVSAVQRSKEGGSSIQSFNWIACASDEMQDTAKREADIVARGRTAKAGRYLRICTSTPKDDSAWRDYRANAKAAPKAGKPVRWSVERMLGRESPFVPDEHWDNMRDGGNITHREYLRRVEAQDVGPERQVYHCWSRAKNLRVIPDGAIDVTAEMLRPWTPRGSRITLLVGHDPGKRQHVSLFLKAYRLPGQANNDTRPRWFIVDEVTSPEATMQSHVLEVLALARSKYKVNRLKQDALTGKAVADPDSPQMLVRIDPHTRSGTAHPGQDVYTRWRQQGIDAKPAAYRPGSITPATIKIESRLDMMNTLLCAKDHTDDGLRRLFVSLGDDNKAAAPQFVKAVESMQRNESGEAEAEAKDADDLSHWPCATGYALWLIEAPRLKLTEAEVAA